MNLKNGKKSEWVESILNSDVSWIHTMQDIDADFDYEADFMRTKNHLSRKIHKNC